MRASCDADHKTYLELYRGDKELVQEEYLRHAEEYLPLMEQQWKWEKELGDAVEEKKVDIKEFLEEEGVWADG